MKKKDNTGTRQLIALFFGLFLGVMVTLIDPFGWVGVSTPAVNRAISEAGLDAEIKDKAQIIAEQESRIAELEAEAADARAAATFAIEFALPAFQAHFGKKLTLLELKDGRKLTGAVPVGLKDQKLTIQHDTGVAVVDVHLLPSSFLAELERADVVEEAIREKADKANR